jgi:sortase (surface protein transpeptidase)
MQSEQSHTGEMPTSGGMRPGPVGQAIPVRSGPAKGVRPVAIRIPSIQVDAEVEHHPAGALLAPSGPYIVAWYASSARLGVPGNVVLAGHARVAGDAAVFARLGELQPGVNIELFGQDLVLYLFAVESNRFVDAADPAMNETANETEEETTLITWDGDIDPGDRIPLQRRVVRGKRVR